MFWNNKLEKKVSSLHKSLVDSFGNVKKDTGRIYEWLNFFYQKNQEQETLINNLKIEVQMLAKTKENSSGTGLDMKSLEPIQNSISHLNNELETIRKHRFEEFQHTFEKISKIDSKIERVAIERNAENKIILEKIKALEERFESIRKHKNIAGAVPDDLERIYSRLEKLEKKKTSIKDKIIRKITKNSKDYLKSIIVSYIKKYGSISAMQLKEMIVEEQGLCSKSSFYRMLEEIESIEEIGTVRKGKEKHYIAKKIKLQ